jgi:hypothetical protein
MYSMKFAHIINSHFLRTAAFRTPSASLYIIRSCVPNVSSVTFPPQIGNGVDVLIRKTFTTSFVSNLCIFDLTVSTFASQLNNRLRYGRWS